MYDLRYRWSLLVQHFIVKNQKLLFDTCVNQFQYTTNNMLICAVCIDSYIKHLLILYNSFSNESKKSSVSLDYRAFMEKPVHTKKWIFKKIVLSRQHFLVLSPRQAKLRRRDIITKVGQDNMLSQTSTYYHVNYLIFFPLQRKLTNHRYNFYCGFFVSMMINNTLSKIGQKKKCRIQAKNILFYLC